MERRHFPAHVADWQRAYRDGASPAPVDALAERWPPRAAEPGYRTGVNALGQIGALKRSSLTTDRAAP